MKKSDVYLRTRGEEADFERGSVFFVGTATVVISYGGFRILTDPNFLHAGDHVHLGYGLTSERLTNPAIEIEDLPHIDFLLLSHLHGDHFDRVAEAKLDKTMPIVTTGHAAQYLEGKAFRPPVALDTWEDVTIRKEEGAWVRVTAMPGTHAPGPLRRVLPPVMGSMLEFGEEGEEEARLRMYISGDTLIHPELRKIPERYPEVDLALLHLGGTRVLGIMVTMDAEQGVEAMRIIDPKAAIPIHYNDYSVFESPLEDFERAVEEAGLEDRVHYLAHGETHEFEVATVRQR
ncbi:MBL fold metallo-hydrolase [Rubrobacter marinus]|uniref:MBL fold metallo-hydrolase n=1 Tax=Rubrobacter marinus TaxID=2653852 RepID=A0A6G8Q066_9ACTN|nr:MBL fold metallo-hydrolase [Rubrobacter marinus]QIN79818.1 MBL fold metallo-hydrolase [Rubrobacter marinus]